MFQYLLSKHRIQTLPWATRPILSLLAWSLVGIRRFPSSFLGCFPEAPPWLWDELGHSCDT